MISIENIIYNIYKVIKEKINKNHNDINKLYKTNKLIK
jgi:hypothetical protein